MSIQGPPENKSMPGTKPGKAPNRDDEADLEIAPPAPLGNAPTQPEPARADVTPIWIRSASPVIITFPLTGNIKR